MAPMTSSHTVLILRTSPAPETARQTLLTKARARARHNQTAAKEIIKLAAPLLAAPLSPQTALNIRLRRLIRSFLIQIRQTRLTASMFAERSEERRVGKECR